MVQSLKRQEGARKLKYMTLSRQKAYYKWLIVFYAVVAIASRSCMVAIVCVPGIVFCGVALCNIKRFKRQRNAMQYRKTLDRLYNAILFRAIEGRISWPDKSRYVR